MCRTGVLRDVNFTLGVLNPMLRDLQPVAPRLGTLVNFISHTVIVGLQPEVAFAMVQLGLAFDDMHTALDLEEGLALLNRQGRLGKSTIGRDGGV